MNKQALNRCISTLDIFTLFTDREYYIASNSMNLKQDKEQLINVLIPYFNANFYNKKTDKSLFDICLYGDRDNNRISKRIKITKKILNFINKHNFKCLNCKNIKDFKESLSYLEINKSDDCLILD